MSLGFKVVRLAKNLFDFGGTRSRAIIRTENFSVLVKKDDTKTVFLMPDLPNLRNARIFGVETITNVEGLPENIKDVNNIQYVNGDLAFNSFVTLVGYNGQEFVKNIPYPRLAWMLQSLINNNTFLFGQRINWSKSYILINSNTLTANISEDGEVFNFLVYYTYDANEQNDDLALPFGNSGQFNQK